MHRRPLYKTVASRRHVDQVDVWSRKAALGHPSVNAGTLRADGRAPGSSVGRSVGRAGGREEGPGTGACDERRLIEKL